MKSHGQRAHESPARPKAALGFAPKLKGGLSARILSLDAEEASAGKSLLPCRAVQVPALWESERGRRLLKNNNNKLKKGEGLLCVAERTVAHTEMMMMMCERD